MIIKKYIVDSFDKVEADIQRDLGPNAVILTSRKIKHQGLTALFFANKIEIIAGVEDNDPYIQQLKEKQTDHKGEWKSSEDSLQAPRLNDVIKAETGLHEPVQYEPSGIPGTYLDPRFNRKQMQEVPQPVPTGALEKKAGFVMPKVELTRAANILMERFSSKLEKPVEFQAVKTTQVEEESTDELFEENVGEDSVMFYQDALFYLISKGLSHANASKILDKVVEKCGSQIITEGLVNTSFAAMIKKEMAVLLETAGPICLRHGVTTAVAFSGASGSGKAGLILQIASQYSRELGKKVLIIGLDAKEPGVVNFYKEECPKLGISFKTTVAWEADEAFDLVLIDLPPQTSDEELLNLEAIKDLEMYVVISATTKDSDAVTAIHKYGHFNLTGLIFTKLDETQSLGVLFNTSRQTGMPISYLTEGSNLVIADPEYIVSAILAKTS